jgi:hypothetical protein
MVSYHPAYVLRQTGGQIDAVKRMVWHDLKAVQRRLSGEDGCASMARAAPEGQPKESDALEVREHPCDGTALSLPFDTEDKDVRAELNA